jgi:two-component system, chemotaxis family, CheB/CheR fusion protein
VAALYRKEAHYCFLALDLQLAKASGSLWQLYWPIRGMDASRTNDMSQPLDLGDVQTFAQDIVDTIREPLIVLDTALRVVHANRAFYRAFQVHPSNTVGRTIYTLGNGQWDIPALRALLEDILATNGAFDEFVVTHDFPTIGERTMLLNARKLYRPGNHTELILVAMEDVSERQRVERERAELLAAAEQATQIRDRFLAIAAHELKNPLASLLGFVQIVQRRLAPGQVWSDRDARALNVIVEQAHRLHHLIDSLFDLSRLERNQLAIVRAPVDLSALAQHEVEAAQLVEGGHRVVLLGAGSPAIVHGDALRLGQALGNLMQNAIKYSPEGSQITVEVIRRAGELGIAVMDEGSGIPEAAQQHLFDLFYRTGDGEQAIIEGSGIGLYVVQQILTLHGGRVTVQSRDGAGSTFTIWLPGAVEQ